MGYFLAPFMIHELPPTLTETASGSHPRCVVSISYDEPKSFHDGSTGCGLILIGSARSADPRTLQLGAGVFVRSNAIISPGLWIWNQTSTFGATRFFGATCVGTNFRQPLLKIH